MDEEYKLEQRKRDLRYMAVHCWAEITRDHFIADPHQYNDGGRAAMARLKAHDIAEAVNTAEAIHAEVEKRTNKL